MAIRRGCKVDASFSAASMTDLMFQLLMFMLIATTLVNPNALRLMLPKSANKVDEKAYTTVSITSDLRYFVEKQQVDEGALEATLQSRLEGIENPIISLNVDEIVPTGKTVMVMDIAKNNHYQVLLATRPQ